MHTKLVDWRNHMVYLHMNGPVRLRKSIRKRSDPTLKLTHATELPKEKMLWFPILRREWQDVGYPETRLINGKYV